LVCFAFKSAVIYCFDTVGIHLVWWGLHKRVEGLLVGFKKSSCVIWLN